MGFFDNLKEKATDLAQTGVAKSKQLAEIAKLKAANMGEEDTIKKAYIEIGKLYFAQSGLSPEGPYAPACERIIAAKAAIEVNNERIAELKAQSGEAEVEEETPALTVADDVTADDIVEEVTDAVEEVVEEVKEAVEELTEE